MKTAHYIRFVQALIIAAIPACTAAVETKNPEPEPATAAVNSARPEGSSAAQADAGADAAAHADASVDGALPFSSGPIVPPELPVGFS